MIDKKKDYRFVSEEAMKNIAVTGHAYPVRKQQLVMIGEDFAFLREAVSERNAIIGSGTKIHDERIRSVKRRIADEFYEEIRNRIGSGSWMDPERFKLLAPPGEVCKQSGEYDIDRAEDASRSANEALTNYRKRRSDRTKEAQDRIDKINEELDETVRSADSECTEKVAEYKSEHEAKLDKINSSADERWDAVTKKWEAEISRLQSELEKAVDPKEKIRIQKEIDKARDDGDQEIENENTRRAKEISDENVEYGIKVAEEWEKHDETVDHAKEDAKKEIDEINKTLKEEQDKDEIGTYESVYSEYSRGVIQAHGGPKMILYERGVDEATVKRSCADEFYRKMAKFAPASTPLYCVFADLERMLILKTGISLFRIPTKMGLTHEFQGWESGLYSLDYFCDNIGIGYNYSMQESNTLKNSDSDSSYSKVAEKVFYDKNSYSYDSTDFGFFFGNRITSEIIDRIVADVEITVAEEYTIWYEEEDDEGEVVEKSQQFKNYQHHLVRVEFEKVDDGDSLITSLDELDDKRQKDLEEINKEYDDKVSELEDKRIAKYEEADKTLQDEIERSDKELESRRQQAHGSYLNSAYGSAANVNARIHKEKDSGKRRKILEDYMDSTVASAEHRMSREISEAEEARRSAVTNAENKNREAKRKADDEFSDGVKDASDKRKDKINDLDESYSERRTSILEAREKEIERIKSRHRSSTRQANERYANAIVKAQKEMGAEIEALDPSKRHPGDEDYDRIVREEEEKEKAAESERNASLQRADMTAWSSANRIYMRSQEARCLWKATISPQGESSYTPSGDDYSYHISFDLSGVKNAFLMFKPKTLTGVNFKKLYEETDSDDKDEKEPDQD